MTANPLGAHELVTGEVRLAFPSLFSPRAVAQDKPDDLKYQCVLLLPPSTDFAPYQAAMMAAATAEWAGEAPAVVQSLTADKLPIKPCERKPGVSGFDAGWFYMNLKSNYQPTCVDEHLNPIIDPAKLFPGCYVRAHVHAYAYRHPSGGNGISFGLDAIQYVRSGERLDGRKAADEVFTPLAVTDTPAVASAATVPGMLGPAAPATAPSAPGVPMAAPGTAPPAVAPPAVPAAVPPPAVPAPPAQTLGVPGVADGQHLFPQQ